MDKTEPASEAKERIDYKQLKGHTPGSWKHDLTEYSQYVFGPDGEMISQVRGWGHLTGKLKLTEEDAMKVQASNCRLMAAAPDLLKENEELYDEITRLKAELERERELRNETHNNAIDVCIKIFKEEFQRLENQKIDYGKYR